MVGDKLPLRSLVAFTSVTTLRNEKKNVDKSSEVIFLPIKFLLAYLGLGCFSRGLKSELLLCLLCAGGDFLSPVIKIPALFSTTTRSIFYDFLTVTIKLYCKLSSVLFATAIITRETYTYMFGRKLILEGSVELAS